MIVKLLTEQHLEFLNLKGGYTGSSESALVKMSNKWKSHAGAHYYQKYLRMIGIIIIILLSIWEHSETSLEKWRIDTSR